MVAATSAIEYVVRQTEGTGVYVVVLRIVHHNVDETDRLLLFFWFASSY